MRMHQRNPEQLRSGDNMHERSDEPGEKQDMRVGYFLEKVGPS